MSHGTFSKKGSLRGTLKATLQNDSKMKESIKKIKLNAKKVFAMYYKNEKLKKCFPNPLTLCNNCEA